MAIVLMAYDADLGHVTSDDEINPALGMKLKIYDRSADGTLEQLATVLLSDRDSDGVLTLTVYRDENVPLGIRTVDYFTDLFTGPVADRPSGPDPRYYTVLRDR